MDTQGLLVARRLFKSSGARRPCRYASKLCAHFFLPAASPRHLIVKWSVSARNGISSHGRGWAISASRTIAVPRAPYWKRSATAYTPLRFPGQYFDVETGLHYNYFRHYDPETARYLTPDPLGLAPAPNPVTYVENPHRWSDPLGLSPCKDRLLDAVAEEAAKASRVTPGRLRPAVSEGIMLRDGKIYTESSRRGDAPGLHPEVQGVLDAIPVEERGRGHGQCGLPIAISEALDRGRDPHGAMGAAVTVRSSVDHPKHGMQIGPCDSCRALVRHYGIDFITGE
jgi:RHS repeat-associated protein